MQTRPSNFISGVYVKPWANGQHQLAERPPEGQGNVAVVSVPEDSSFLQQSEKPLRAARCKGNIP